MKIIIPSWQRPHCPSARVFPTATVVVHTENQRMLYIRANPKAQVVVSGAKTDQFGLTRQREWAVQNLVDEGEWFVFADDNIFGLTAVPLPAYRTPELPVQENPETRGLFKTRCTAGYFLQTVVPDTINYALRVGARMCGFALVDNHFFRGKKFRSVGYVIGKLMLMRNSGLTFDHTITMEDFRNTADHLYRFGSVVVNNYAFPLAKHYEPGGMGEYDKRIPHRLKDVQKLLTMYPGLFRVKDRKGFVPNTDLQLTMHSKEQIEKWRRGLAMRRRG